MVKNLVTIYKSRFSMTVLDPDIVGVISDNDMGKLIHWGRDKMTTISQTIWRQMIM